MANSNSQSKIAILILAAGESKRMGTPKQLLKWGKSTLLNHSITQAVNSKADSVFVVLGANFDTIKDSIDTDDVTVLKYADWKLGMGNSIAFGIQKIWSLAFDGVTLMLVDQPQIDTSFLNKLILEFQQSEKPIIATGYKNGAGVPAVFDKTYFEQLVSLSGKKGGRLLINNNLSNATLITSIDNIADIDTMEAYEKLNQQYFNEA